MFAILFEVLLIEIQKEIHHFAGWEEGGGQGHKNCEQKFCEQTGVSYLISEERVFRVGTPLILDTCNGLPEQATPPLAVGMVVKLEGLKAHHPAHPFCLP